MTAIALTLALALALTIATLIAFALVMVGPPAAQHVADWLALGPVFGWTWNIAVLLHESRHPDRRATERDNRAYVAGAIRTGSQTLRNPVLGHLSSRERVLAPQRGDERLCRGRRLGAVSQYRAGRTVAPVEIAIRVFVGFQNATRYINAREEALRA